MSGDYPYNGFLEEVKRIKESYTKLDNYNVKCYFDLNLMDGWIENVDKMYNESKSYPEEKRGDIADVVDKIHKLDDQLQDDGKKIIFASEQGDSFEKLLCYSDRIKRQLLNMKKTIY